MLAQYRTVFRARGAAQFCAAAWVMRLPMAMYPIGLVLIVSAREGRYGLAGLLSGVYVFANGVGNPVLARVTDRLGQRALLVPASLVHSLAAIGAAVVASADGPFAVLAVLSAVAGLAFLPVESLVRARWSFVLDGRAQVDSAYSLESTLDETVFVLGPLLATLLATQLDPVLVLYVGATLVLSGSVWLATQRASEPPSAPVAARRRPAVFERGMPMLVLAIVAVGVIFSSAEVTVVAFCGQRGERGLSGALLAAFAAGSATSGFLYGARQWRAPLLDRFRLQAAVLAVLPPVLLLATNIGVLAVCIYVVGLGIAPALTTAFGLVQSFVPAGSLTEGLAWLVTGISVGYGTGAALVGRVADAHGARLAFLVTVSAGVLLALLGAAVHARMRQAPG